MVIWCLTGVINTVIFLYVFVLRGAIPKQLKRLEIKRESNRGLHWHQHRPLVIIIGMLSLLILGTVLAGLKVGSPETWTIGVNPGATVLFVFAVAPTQITGFFGVPRRVRRIYRAFAVTQGRERALADKSAHRLARFSQLAEVPAIIGTWLLLGSLFITKGSAPVDNNGPSQHTLLHISVTGFVGFGMMAAGVVHFLVIVRFNALMKTIKGISGSLLGVSPSSNGQSRNSASRRQTVKAIRHCSRAMLVEMAGSGLCKFLIGLSICTFMFYPPLWRYGSTLAPLWVLLGAFICLSVGIGMTTTLKVTRRPRPAEPASAAATGSLNRVAPGDRPSEAVTVT